MQKELVEYDGTRRVCLIIDSKEKEFERFKKLCWEQGIPVLRRKLPSGDYLWVLLPAGAKADYSLEEYESEHVRHLVLNFESKVSSVKTNQDG